MQGQMHIDGATVHLVAHKSGQASMQSETIAAEDAAKGLHSPSDMTKAAVGKGLAEIRPEDSFSGWSQGTGMGSPPDNRLELVPRRGGENRQDRAPKLEQDSPNSSYGHTVDIVTFDMDGRRRRRHRAITQPAPAASRRCSGDEAASLLKLLLTETAGLSVLLGVQRRDRSFEEGKKMSALLSMAQHPVSSAPRLVKGGKRTSQMGLVAQARASVVQNMMKIIHEDAGTQLDATEAQRMRTKAEAKMKQLRTLGLLQYLKEEPQEPGAPEITARE
eukprot:gene5878-7079_t